MLTVTEVAARLRCSAQQVRLMYRDGRFPPPIRAGRRFVWDPPAVEAWIRQQHEPKVAPAAAAQGREAQAAR